MHPDVVGIWAETKGQAYCFSLFGLFIHLTFYLVYKISQKVFQLELCYITLLTSEKKKSDLWHSLAFFWTSI